MIIFSEIISNILFKRYPIISKPYSICNIFFNSILSQEILRTKFFICKWILTFKFSSYEDDVDEGDTIIYTGAGGNRGGKQVADQELTGTNAGTVSRSGFFIKYHYRDSKNII